LIRFTFRENGTLVDLEQVGQLTDDVYLCVTLEISTP